jgi:hypothetical protein
MASHRDILKSEGSRWCRSFSIAKAVERQDALSFKSAMIGGLSFAQATHHMQDRFRRPGLPHANQSSPENVYGLRSASRRSLNLRS